MYMKIMLIIIIIILIITTIIITISMITIILIIIMIIFNTWLFVDMEFFSIYACVCTTHYVNNKSSECRKIFGISMRYIKGRRA